MHEISLPRKYPAFLLNKNPIEFPNWKEFQKTNDISWRRQFSKTKTKLAYSSTSVRKICNKVMTILIVKVLKNVLKLKPTISTYEDPVGISSLAYT